MSKGSTGPHRMWIRGLVFLLPFGVAANANAQLVDRILSPNISNEGIAKSFVQQIGAGRGTINTPDSSLYIIARDPARAVRRGGASPVSTGCYAGPSPPHRETGASWRRSMPLWRSLAFNGW